MLFLYRTIPYQSAVYWSHIISCLYISILTIVCILALQIVILWFLCFYTTHMQCQLCWWIMQRKVYLKEMNANYYLLLFTLMCILKVCFWFGVHHSLIWLKFSVAINVCPLCFRGAKCSLQWLNSLPCCFQKNKIYVFQTSVHSLFHQPLKCQTFKSHPLVYNYNFLLKMTLHKYNFYLSSEDTVEGSQPTGSVDCPV